MSALPNFAGCSAGNIIHCSTASFLPPYAVCLVLSAAMPLPMLLFHAVSHSLFAATLSLFCFLSSPPCRFRGRVKLAIFATGAYLRFALISNLPHLYPPSSSAVASLRFAPLTLNHVRPVSSQARAGSVQQLSAAARCPEGVIFYRAFDIHLHPTLPRCFAEFAVEARKFPPQSSRYYC